MQSATKQLWASAAAAIIGSLCCVAPLVLLTLGISGAWISQLTALEPYRPIFIGVMLLFIGPLKPVNQLNQINQLTHYYRRFKRFSRFTWFI